MNGLSNSLESAVAQERMRAAAQQGGFAFFSSMPFWLCFVAALREHTAQQRVILWLSVLLTLYFSRWIFLSSGQRKSDSSNQDMVGWTKAVLVIFNLIAGLWWSIGIIWFLDPTQPYSIPIVSLGTIHLIVGIVLVWFYYLPAVLATLLPSTITLLGELVFIGDRTTIFPAVLLSVSAVSVIFGCLQIARMYDTALRLNFENLLLRKESEEKSLLLETALENMDQGISMSDQHDRLRMWNRHFVDLLGAQGAGVATDADLSSLLQAASPPIHVSADQRSEYRPRKEQVYEIRQSNLTQGGRVLTSVDISDRIRRE
ncbi:MAG: PAS-domain containing protein [Gammaproteobacteria bacterium]